MSQKWRHPKYAIGYCYELGGRVVLRVANRKRSTPLAWTSDNKATALKMLEALIAEHYNAKSRATAAPTTVWELGQLYVKAHHTMSDTARRHLRDMFHALFPADCPLTADAITTTVLAREKGGAWASQTLHKFRKQAQKLCDYGVAMSWLERNPVRLLPRLNIVARSVTIFAPDDVERIALAIEERDPRARPAALLVRFLYLTGMRIGEALAMRWHDVTADTIMIRGKGSRPRAFPLGPFPDVVAILNERRATGCPNVWPWLHATNPRERFNHATEALGYPSSTCIHHLRASAEYRFELMGLPVEVICDLTGHTLATYERHYRKRKTARELAGRIEAAIATKAANSGR